MKEASGVPPWPAVLADERNTAATTAPGPRGARHLWSYSAPGRTGFSGPPIVDGEGRLYLGTRGALVALSPEGRPLWSADAPGRVGAPALDRNGGLVAGVHGRGLLLVSRDGRRSRLVERAFDEPCPPAVAPDGRVYVAARGELCAFDAEGRPLWSAPLEGAPSRPPLAAADGTIRVKSRGTYASADDASECSDAVAAWSRDGRPLENAGAPSGYNADGAGWGSGWYGGDCAPLAGARGPTIVGLGREIRVDGRSLPVAGNGPLALSPRGGLYVGTRAGLVALELDGAVRWRADAGGAVSFPVVDGEGRVYCTRHDGTALAFDGEGRALWSWAAPREHPGMAVEYALSIGAGATLYMVAWDALHALGEI